MVKLVSCMEQINLLHQKIEQKGCVLTVFMIRPENYYVGKIMLHI